MAQPPTANSTTAMNSLLQVLAVKRVNGYLSAAPIVKGKRDARNSEWKEYVQIGKGRWLVPERG